MFNLAISIYALLVGYLIAFLGDVLRKWINKKIVYGIEAFLGFGYIIYLLFTVEEKQSIIGVIAFLVHSWAIYGSTLSTNEQESKFKQLIQERNVTELTIHKKLTRPLMDTMLSSVVIAVSIIYLIYGPNPVISVILLFTLSTLASELIKRFIIYRSIKIYYEEETQTLLVINKLEPKKYPLVELTDIELQSNVDVLKLFPMFTLFMSNTDFTTSMGQTVKLSFPGEKVYVNIDIEKLPQLDIDTTDGIESKTEIIEKQILPFYHKKNMKRLLGKGYFAITVKGIGAYAALILILSFLNVSPWGITAIVLSFWLINILISEKILKIALDVEEITNPDVLGMSEGLFQKAGLPTVSLYQTESTEYNGFAAGANIGRSMITLTSETLKLPIDAIEGILAHEIVHVKKRDILVGQLLRFVYIGILVGIVFLIDVIFHENKILLAIFIYIMIIFSPAIYSLLTQWMEVRADHLGATLLKCGNEQMAESLTILSKNQDEAIEKSANYSVVDVESDATNVSSIERDKWFWRFIEFQFMAHPPMYWRINSLKTSETEWTRGVIKRWWIDRLKDSLPEIKIKKS